MNRAAVRTVALVGSAGALGALCRYLVSLLGAKHEAAFPWPTLTINLVGCLLLAFLFYSERLFRSWNEPLRIGLSVGFLGSFTTFSAWSVETVQLWEQNRLWLACAYMFLSIGGGWLMVVIGRWIAGKDNARIRQTNGVQR